MGVHSQGESGFFDEDTELPVVQNESEEQHETASANVAGKLAAFGICLNHSWTLICMKCVQG